MKQCDTRSSSRYIVILISIDDVAASLWDSPRSMVNAKLNNTILQGQIHYMAATTWRALPGLESAKICAYVAILLASTA